MRKGRAGVKRSALAGEDFPRRRDGEGLPERRCGALNRPGSSANEKGGDGESYRGTRGDGEARRRLGDGGPRRRWWLVAVDGERLVGAARRRVKRAPVDATKLLVASNCAGVASIAGLTANQERGGGLDERALGGEVGKERGGRGFDPKGCGGV